MKTVVSPGTAPSIPEPACTSGDAPASRAIAHPSGAASAPSSTNGSSDASCVGPSSQMNGTCTIDASGAQCALLGTGKCGFAGIRPPTSMKVHRKFSLKPLPAAMLRAMSM